MENPKPAQDQIESSIENDHAEDEESEEREYSSPPCYLHEFGPLADGVKKNVPPSGNKPDVTD